MDISLLLNETTDSMDPKQLRQVVREDEIANFLKANELASEISQQLMDHTVISIEMECWNRTIDGKKVQYPVLVFLVDGADKLFQKNKAAKIIYDKRLADKTNTSKPVHKGATQATSSTASTVLPVSGTTDSAPPDNSASTAQVDNPSPITSVSTSTQPIEDPQVHNKAPEPSDAQPLHTEKPTKTLERDIYGEFHQWKKAQALRLEAYKKKVAVERRIYALQESELATSSQISSTALQETPESEQTLRIQVPAIESTTIDPLESEQTLSAPRNMDDPEQLKALRQHKEQLRLLAVDKLEKHKRELEQKVEKFMTDEGDRFNRLVEDSFKTVSLFLSGGRRLCTLSNGVALKLMGEDKEIASTYRKLMQETLANYYVVANANYNGKLREIELEYRAILRSNWPDPRDRAQSERQLDAVRDKGLAFEPKKHVFTTETGLERIGLRHFEQEKDKYLESFHEHAKGQLKGIREEIYKPTLLEHRLEGGEDSTMQVLPDAHKPVRFGLDNRESKQKKPELLDAFSRRSEDPSMGLFAETPAPHRTQPRSIAENSSARSAQPQSARSKPAPKLSSSNVWYSDSRAAAAAETFMQSRDSGRRVSNRIEESALRKRGDAAATLYSSPNQASNSRMQVSRNDGYGAQPMEIDSSGMTATAPAAHTYTSIPKHVNQLSTANAYAAQSPRVDRSGMNTTVSGASSHTVNSANPFVISNRHASQSREVYRGGPIATTVATPTYSSPVAQHDTPYQQSGYAGTNTGAFVASAGPPNAATMTTNNTGHLQNRSNDIAGPQAALTVSPAIASFLQRTTARNEAPAIPMQIASAEATAPTGFANAIANHMETTSVANADRGSVEADPENATVVDSTCTETMRTDQVLATTANQTSAGIPSPLIARANGIPGLGALPSHSSHAQVQSQEASSFTAFGGGTSSQAGPSQTQQGQAPIAAQDSNQDDVENSSGLFVSSPLPTEQLARESAPARSSPSPPYSPPPALTPASPSNGAPASSPILFSPIVPREDTPEPGSPAASISSMAVAVSPVDSEPEIPIAPKRQEFLDTVREQDRMLRESVARDTQDDETERKNEQIKEMLKGKSISELLKAAKKRKRDADESADEGRENGGAAYGHGYGGGLGGTGYETF